MKVLTITRKPAILIIILMSCLILPLRAGFFFDDPVELQSQRIPHLLAKDEIRFTPCGKCAQFAIFYAEVALELKYPTGNKTLSINKTLWTADQALIVALPDGLGDLQSYRLTGKYKMILAPKKNRKFDPNAADQSKEILRNSDVIQGYKIDSYWTVK
jgi:hypothetical protein